MPPSPLLRRAAPPPAPWMTALCAAAMLAAMLPGGRWSDMLALLAAAAALSAAHDGRNRDMLVAAGLAAGLAPAGLLLAPLCIGLAIRRRAARHLPVALIVGLLTASALPWSRPIPALPNLALVAQTLPSSLALVAPLGIGIAAWLGARATARPPGGTFAEARLGALLLATVLPLPPGVLGFVLMLAALPLPAPRRLHAANDNSVVRRVVRLAA